MIAACSTLATAPSDREPNVYREAPTNGAASRTIIGVALPQLLARGAWLFGDDDVGRSRIDPVALGREVRPHALHGLVDFIAGQERVAVLGFRPQLTLLIG